MKMKKVLAILLSVAVLATVCVCLVACGEENKNEKVVSFQPLKKEDIKFGLITLHDTTSTYDKNFIDAAKQAVNDMGLDENTQLVIIRSATPAGILTVTTSSPMTIPSPPHSLHLFLIILPSPLQWGQTLRVCIAPKMVCCVRITVPVP